MGITNNKVEILVIENSESLKSLFENELFADWNFDYMNNVRHAGKFISKHDYGVVILNTDLSKRENIYFLDLLINTIEEKPFVIISDIGENDLCFNIASECSDAYFNRNQITPEKLHTKLKELQRTNNVFPEEFHLKNLVDHANYGIGIIDLAGKFVYINKYFAEIHGYKPEEIIGKNVEIFHTQEQFKRVKKINSDLKKNFKYGPLEVWHKTKTGHEFPMLMTGIGIKDNKNNVKYISATAIDISENIKIQENLKESEKKFRLIFEHSEDAIFWANFDTGIIINCNKKAEKLLEMDRNELIGKPHTILHPPEIRDDVRNSFSKMEMQKDNVISETYLFSKSGKRIPVRISSTIIKADNEKIIQGVFHNISELKSKEEELKKSQELYKLIAENTGDGVILTENGVIKYASPSFEKISGYNSGDFINKPVSYLFNFIHKDDVANVIDTIQTDIEQNKKVSSYSFRFKRQNNEYIWIENLVRREYDENEKNIKSIVTSIDITQREKTEQALKESRERFALAVKGSNDGIWDWDIKTNELFLSQRWKAQVGYSNEELANEFSTFEKLLHSDDKKRVMSIVKEYLAGKTKEYDVEFRLKHKQGHYVWIHARGEALRDENGKPYRMAGSHTDITKRKEKEIDLKESEERFKKLSNLTFEGIVLHKNGILLDANNALLEMTGYQLEEIIGENILELIILPKHLDTIKEKLAEQYALPYEVEIKTKCGKIIPVEIEARNTVWKGEQIRVAAVRDLTERKKIERKISALASVVENSNDIIVVKDLNLRVIATNMAFVKASGYKAIDELIGKTDAEIFNVTPDTEPIRSYMEDEKKAQKLKKGQALVYEEPVVLPDGSEKYVLTKKYPIYNQDNELIGTGNISVDITERKKIEEQIKKLSLAVEQAANAFVITDVEGNITFTNKTFEKYTGYTSGEVLGENPRILKSGYHGDDYYKELWEQISGGKKWHGKFKNKRKDGSFYWENALITPVKNENNEIISFIAIKEDITEKIESEKQREIFIKELKDTNEKVMKLSEMKDYFVGIVSHDLRTPFNTILGFSELLLDSEIDDEHKECAHYIKESAELQLNYINDLLEIFKTDADQMTLKATEDDIKSLIQYVMFNSKVLANKKQIQITSIIESDVKVMIDYTKVVQVLTNLVANAIKFSPRNSEITIKSFINENREVEIHVIDQGIGIPEDKIDQIFNRFNKYQKPGTEGEKGSGLGLYICKILIELHKGKINVKSEKGKGSDFYFTLPIN